MWTRNKKQRNYSPWLVVKLTIKSTVLSKMNNKIIVPASLGRALLNKFLMQSYYIIWNFSKLCVLRRKTHFIKLNSSSNDASKTWTLNYDWNENVSMPADRQVLLWKLEKENIVVNLIELIQHLFQLWRDFMLRGSLLNLHMAAVLSY